MGIFLLNPPESQCNPTSAAEHRPRHATGSAQRAVFDWGTCGRCRCVPEWYKISSPVLSGNSLSGDHYVQRFWQTPQGFTVDVGTGHAYWRSPVAISGQTRRWWLTPAPLTDDAAAIPGWIAFLSIAGETNVPLWIIPGSVPLGDPQYWECLGTNQMNAAFELDITDPYGS